jgi:hypothetical protein
MQQHDQYHHIDGRLQDGLHGGVRKPAPHEDHAAEAKKKVEDRGADKQLRGLHADTARASQGVEAEQHKRDQ